MGKNGILPAKLTLAFSILYGVLFCASLLVLYDEYGRPPPGFARLLLAGSG